MAAGRRGMNCVGTFELLQNIDRNTVVMQFKQVKELGSINGSIDLWYF